MRRRQLPRVGGALAAHSRRPHTAAEIDRKVCRPRVRPFADRINVRRAMSESLEVSASMGPVRCRDSIRLTPQARIRE
jgi:hypothetical protein